MAGWLDPFPDSPVVLHDDGSGNPVPVPRAIAARFGFAPAAPVAAPPEPMVANPAITQPLAPEPIAPPNPTTRLAQEQAQAAARDLVAEPAPKATGAPAADSPPMAPPQMVVEPEQRGPTIAPDGTEIDAVSGGQAAMPVEAPQQFASQLGGADYSPVTTAGQEAASVGPQSQYEIDQQAASERRRLIEGTNQAIAVNEANRAVAMKEMANDYAKLQKDLAGAIQKSADHKIDPRRKWHNMSTGSKIGAVIFSLISGIGSALKGQGDKNPALDIIKAAIDQDLSLQFAERDKLAQNVAAKRQQLGDFQGLVTNRQAQFLAERSAILESEARKYESIAAKAADEGVKFQYAAIAEQMRAAAQADAEKAAQQDFENGIKFAETRAKIDKLDAETAKLRRQGVGGGALAGKAGTGGQYHSLDQIDPKFRDKAVRLPDGSWMITNSKDSATKAAETMAASTAMVQNLDRALTKVASMPGAADKLAGKAGFESDDIAVIKQELSQLMLNSKEFYNLGAISESDLNIINSLGADQNAVTAFREKVWPKLQNWRDGITQDALAKVRQYGVDTTAEAAYGSAPARPRAKQADEWTSEITASPTWDGDMIVGGPNISDAEKQLEGLRDSVINEGGGDAEWRAAVGQVVAGTNQNISETNRQIDKVNGDIAKAKKQGKKGDAQVSSLTQKKVQLAAQLANYLGIKKRAEEKKAQSIEKQRTQADAAKAEDARLKKQAEDTRKKVQAGRGGYR